jgi:hypothetical protein
MIWDFCGCYNSNKPGSTRSYRSRAAIETDILADTGAFIHAMPYCAGSYRERTPLMHEIRRDGIDL